ncbi:MAG: tRNA uridine-5-carboxymethylaminomethyl(34) synthesis GTPase MnmE, partial [Myxococcales bacterium]|nr:tRNA uridine-5-carboxymethylaminomethyl(34) synthesis GTPase MnmE [Myxococcales bacterium]
RQAEHLRALAEACEGAVEALELAGVAVAADELVHGLAAVDALTGADTREDVLDALFARFCIGK